MSDDLDTLLRTIVAPQPRSVCIWIEAGRMCGKPADPQRLGMCAEHWETVRDLEHDWRDRQRSERYDDP